jgi:hypothetical protein
VTAYHAYGWIDVVSDISSRFLVSFPIYLSMICVLRQTDSVCRSALNTSVSESLQKCTEYVSQ